MKQEIDPFEASGMADNNAVYVARAEAFLESLVLDAPRHAQFLNMLSMLEHMGSRKIMVSHMNRPEGIDQDTLQHLAEEARHAYFFKRHAERINGAPMKGWVDENTMSRVPALMYFGRMDAGISKQLETLASPRRRGSLDGNKEILDQVGDADTSYDAYGWVSLIIELRACWLYRIYNDVVEAAGVHLPLKGLIAEEDGHLAEMFGMCGENYDLLKTLSAYETTLFVKLWGALEVACSLDMDKAKAA